MSVRRILLTTDTVGGVWTYSLDLAGALGKAGIATVLVTMGPPPGAAQRTAVADLDGVTLIESDTPLDWLAPGAAAVAAAGGSIAAIARAHSVDLVQLHAPALAAAVEFAMPVVVVAHSCVASWWDAAATGPVPEDLAWRGALTRTGLVAADVVIAPSQAFAALVERVHRLAALPTVVHNGRSPMVTPPRVQVAHAFTAGRLWDHGKNVETLDRAAGMGVPIVAAGPLAGPNGDSLRVDHLTCMGTLSPAEVGAQLAARPVFVSAALYEPFGLAVLEAAQAGCALVLADIPTFRELWQDAAIFVNPRDAAGFNAAITRLLADPAERALAGAKAALAAERYTLAAMRDGMVAVYKSASRSRNDRVAA